MLRSEADAATAAASPAAVAVKRERTPPAADVKEEPGQGEQEDREQLAKRDAELAKERAGCLKLQRCGMPSCSNTPCKVLHAGLVW